MRFRALDANGDWTYGKGQNNYAQSQLAAQLMIQTWVLCFLQDCFFDASNGVNWFAYLGAVGAEIQTALNLAVSARILNTPDNNGNQLVLGLDQLSVNLNRQTRNLTISYNAITIFGTVTGAFTYDLNGLD